MSTSPNESSTDRLPPISVMDSFIAGRSWPPPTSSISVPSRPAYSEHRLSSPAMHSLSYAHSQAPSHYPPSQHQRQHSLPGTSLSSSSSSSSYTIASSATATAHFPSADRSIDMDIDEVVRHCDILSDQMRRNKTSLVDDAQDPAHVRPWLDDLISRANDVLNALLRLRKHQIAAEYARLHGMESHPPPQLAQHQPLPQSPPVARRSSRHNEQNDWHETALSLSSIRQRKRGKRAVFQGRCHSCNISETPEWRRGPDGARTLCNACGLHYAKLARKKAQAQPQDKKVSYDVLQPDLTVRKPTQLLSPSTTDEPMDEVEVATS